MEAQTPRLRVPDRIAKLIRAMHPDLRKKIRASLETLAADPASGIRLYDKRGDLRSFCTGKLRIIYRVREKDISEILAVGPRETIYAETYRLLCRKSPE
jgi:mRNA interferase RelE/StbE